MPRFISLLRAVVMAFGCVIAAPATAADYVIAAPQVLHRQHAQTLYADVQRLVLEDAEPDDVIRIVDATDLKTVAVFKIPTGGKARVKNLRIDALSEPLAAWKRFVAERYLQAAQPPAGGEGRILLPQLLDHLGAEAYADRPRDQREICVLVVGSAQHRDPREPSFDMIAGRFPADGLLLASRTRSPYGTADRQGRLQGIFVNMLALDQDWLNELHRLRTHRAWQLFVEAQGGVLATFTADRTVAQQRFITCERKPAETFAWDSTRTTEAMITVERLAQAAEEPQPISEAVVDEVDHEPDARGQFGKVVRVDQSVFADTAGLIAFDEVPLRTANPRYLPRHYGGTQDGISVQFGGYFLGQRLGQSNECPPGANLGGCVIGVPGGPLTLDPDSPSVFTAEDRSNPTSPSLSGSPIFDGPVSMLFERDVAAVGLVGGHFNRLRSTAIQAFDRHGNLIGGVVNTSLGMEFLALATEDGSERIAGIQFSLVGPEPNGYGIDDVYFALHSQLGPTD